MILLQIMLMSDSAEASNVYSPKPVVRLTPSVPLGVVKFTFDGGSIEKHKQSSNGNKHNE